MTSRTVMLKPGLLVGLHTSIEGGVRYFRTDLPVMREAPEGGDVARWETEREISDSEEHERAVKARSKAQALIRGECSYSKRFGLLCPQDNEPALDEAIRSAEAVAEQFNRSARYSRVEVNTIKGRVSATDEQATASLVGEMRALLGEMESGVRALDAGAIRKAAGRARELGAMLDESQGDRVADAVKAARDAARQIVRRVEKAGEDGSAVLRDLNTRAISSARFAFLDSPEDAQEELIEVQEAPRPVRGVEVASYDGAPVPEALSAAPKAGDRFSGLWILEG